MFLFGSYILLDVQTQGNLLKKIVLPLVKLVTTHILPLLFLLLSFTYIYCYSVAACTFLTNKRKL
jgi:hypothetical protein